MKIESLRPGLSRVEIPSPTLPPATCTNAWILGEDDIIVVDPAGKDNDVKDQFRELLFLKNIRAIFLTHHHTDHICGVTHLANATGAEIWASDWTRQKTGLKIDRLIYENDVIETPYDKWRALLTPGHAAGHLCLSSEENGDIVAGDMVAGVGTILLAKPEGCLKKYFNSLNRLIEENPRRLLPAHGPAITPAIPYLKHYITHRQMRNTQIMAALETRTLKVDEIAKMVYSDLPKAFMPLAIMQIDCHLQWLMDHKMVSINAENGYQKQI